MLRCRCDIRAWLAPGKLIVASARLPVALSWSTADERWSAAASPGGLATALRSVAAQREFTWIGFPGTPVDPDQCDAVTEALSDHGVPVFLDQDEFEGFYEQFSNRFLWPLFHSLPTPSGYDPNAWEVYRKVNQRFADVIAEQASPGDTIWVHDYQLALVPGMLRDKELDCAIGYFLHIPFPPSETFRTLPVREAVLHGLLGANFVAFHSYEYVSHFRTATLRILGVESDPEHVLMPGHHAHFGVLPIGIDPDEIDRIAKIPEVQERLESLKTQFAGKKVVLGVDRLDYTKGLPQRLLAIEELLSAEPELSQQMVMIQVAAPSRTGVAEYQSLKREIDELVGRINGEYGAFDNVPIVYINQNVDREELVALYQVADVMLVTPVRDGMNLVCLEYVGARGAIPGTLILSEFAGAATCLSGATLVNPFDPSQMAKTLAKALKADAIPQAFKHMQEFVRGNTSMVWAERFLKRLEESYTGHRSRAARLNVETGPAGVWARDANRPLVLLDYDGTLVEHTRLPSQAIPTDRLRELLKRLARVANTYVISGRPSETLDEWLGDLGLGLVCEHGLAFKPAGGSWSERPQIASRALENIVAPLFRDFTERTPGSRIERKTASLAWHYRGSDAKLGAWRAKELRNLLESQLSDQPYTVLPGSKVVEVRHVQVTKGNATATILDRYPESDFVLCAGNDRTDEDMFAALQVSGRDPKVVCFVGSVHSSAEYFTSTPAELLDQLEVLVGWWEKRDSGSESS